jgi:redox-sensitive bicupin YhaK (pirin superfamily)
MIVERPGSARGAVRAGWLDSRHTFSFGQYHDPQWMVFGPLRVINEDRVAPVAGFPPHGHANM